MKLLFASAAILSLTAGGAVAAEPIGDWLVKDGYAHIRIDNCAGKMWGVVAWEKTPGAIDNENPDAARKGRPILGMPILLGMKPTKPNLWEGEIYNSNNGKTYDAKISLTDDNTLKLEGCVGWGLLCGGENWTRVTTPPSGPGLPPPGTKSAPAAQSKGPAAKGSQKGPAPDKATSASASRRIRLPQRQAEPRQRSDRAAPRALLANLILDLARLSHQHRLEQHGRRQCGDERECEQLAHARRARMA